MARRVVQSSILSHDLHSNSTEQNVMSWGGVSTDELRPAPGGNGMPEAW